MLEELTGLPCAGVVPWMKVSLDEEDSQASKLQEKECPEEKGGLDLAVIRLNHLSNFTDFGPLELLEGASVRYVQDPRKLGTPDLILLPGSKNTMGDLRALRESGMEGRILAAQRKGIPIFGICGGFQMLGEKISDPEGAEGGGEIRGMGLLPIETVFSGEKIRSRVEGHFLEVGGIFQKLSGLCFSGYEMHMGESFRKSGAALTEISRQMGDQKGSPDGNAKALIQEGTSQGNVYGSYVHGIFDSEAVLEALSEALAERKGGGYARMHKVQNLARFREQQFQELASVLRKSLDLDLIYHILEGSGQSAPGPKADGKLIKT
jgi:adenosylcobyric acid synthase